MKLFKFLTLTTLISFTSTVTYSQSPDDNFIPKNPVADNLLTAENTVLLLIEWQPDLINVVQNIDQDVMMNNVQSMVKTAVLFDIPIIESTIGVQIAGSQPTVPIAPRTKYLKRPSLGLFKYLVLSALVSNHY